MSTNIPVVKTADEKERRATLYVKVSTAALVRQVARHEHKSVALLVEEMTNAWIATEHPEWEVVDTTKAKAKAKRARRA